MRILNAEDKNNRIKCTKRIKLQLKKKLFDAKLIGDIREQNILKNILLNMEK